ncbi:formimidoylglutamate deiminase [Segnochrobactrum spirostomi]|uniref:Formimidoylglutamate deiminase n=1 Tax=Segnochrobactrum spirostomi TaxID=2608987 RepID=A0A6A7Y5H2_9HYPH|nr:formimidoylglutamate deiminase [Segnochrobactrum spirostomi]MQT13597.1 formimidoylglutamate deiminase [Segnochrobactrum spirostomi]
MPAADTPASLWFETALLPQGWASGVRLTLTDGRIAAIETGTAPAAGEERHAIALPGLPNLHSHAFQRGMAGLAEVRGPAGDSFWTWRETMYRFVDRMNPDDVEAIAAQAYMEMLETGFTRVGEFHYVHHDTAGAPYANLAEMAERIAAAAAETGIGLTLLPVFYAHAGFGGLPPGHGQRRFINDLEGYATLLGGSRKAVAGLKDAVVGIAPHSLRAATIEEIEVLVPLADGGPIHIHIAEQTKEVEDCVAWSGRRSVELLFERIAVDDLWCLVHATHMTDAERIRFAASGAVAGLCPITEANLGDGIFPARAFVSEGGRWGVGSDSNIRIAAAEELRLLEDSQRLSLRARNVLAGAEGRATGRDLFDAALAGGTQVLTPGEPAGLVTGAAADFLTLAADHPAFAARRGDALLDGWVFAARDRAIDGVWRAGVQVVEGGRHRARAAIEASFRKTLEGLLG